MVEMVVESFPQTGTSLSGSPVCMCVEYSKNKRRSEWRGRRLSRNQGQQQLTESDQRLLVDSNQEGEEVESPRGESPRNRAFMKSKSANGIEARMGYKRGHQPPHTNGLEIWETSRLSMKALWEIVVSFFPKI